MQRITSITIRREFGGFVTRTSLFCPLKKSSFIKQPLWRRWACIYTYRKHSFAGLTTFCSFPKRNSHTTFLPCHRLYSTESENEGKNPIVSVIGIPDPITWFRNKVHMYLIEVYYDLGITTVDFDNGVKQALVHVSNMMSTGNIDALTGLLSKEMMEYADKRCKALTESQRQHLAISLEDIVFLLPEDVTLLFHHGKKDVYIVIRFWYLSRADGPDDPESTKMFKVTSSEEDCDSQKIVTAVYEFHRELTKGAAPDWTVTSIWHWHLKQTE